MAKVILDGFSPREAKLFTDWYKQSGQNKAQEWFEKYNEVVPTPKRKKIDKKSGDIIINCVRDDLDKNGHCTIKGCNCGL